MTPAQQPHVHALREHNINQHCDSRRRTHCSRIRITTKQVPGTPCAFHAYKLGMRRHPASHTLIWGMFDFCCWQPVHAASCRQCINARAEQPPQHGLVSKLVAAVSEANRLTRPLLQCTVPAVDNWAVGSDQTWCQCGAVAL